MGGSRLVAVPRTPKVLGCLRAAQASRMKVGAGAPGPSQAQELRLMFLCSSFSTGLGAQSCWEPWACPSQAPSAQGLLPAFLPSQEQE